MIANAIDRMMSKVNKTDYCWIWTGAKKPSGYGNFWMDGRYYNTHRASYLLHRGEIPDGLVVMHKCDNPSCVNPDHLSIGTSRDNVRDMMAKGRSYGSPMGSEFAPCVKLTKEQVIEIRKMLESNVKHKALADKFSVCRATISLISTRKTWRNI